MTVDALTLSKRLEGAGLPRAHAEEIAGAIRDAQDVRLADLVTRADLKLELSALRSEFKGELSALRSEFKGELSAFRHDTPTRAEMDVVKADLALVLQRLDRFEASTEARFDAIVGRFGFVDGRFEQMVTKAQYEAGLRSMIMWMVGSMATMTGLAFAAARGFP